MNANDEVKDRILITGDEADARWTLVHVMRLHGFEPIEALSKECHLIIPDNRGMAGSTQERNTLFDG